MTKIYGPLEQAGYELIAALPTVDVFEGRIIALDDGNIYVYFDGEWKLQGSLTQAIKTVPSLDPLDDAGDIVGLDVDGLINSGFIRTTDKLPPQSDPATTGFILESDGTNASWVEFAGGGLTPVFIDETFVAVAEDGKNYIMGHSAPFSIQLPPATNGDRIGFANSSEAGSWADFNVTLLRDGSDTIDGDPSLVCDVDRVWVELYAEDGNWQSRDPFQPMLATGSSGGFGGGKNYILNPDGTTGTNDLNTTGVIVLEKSTDPAEIPEQSKASGLKITSGNIGDYVEWLIRNNAIDSGDSNINFQNEIYVKTLSGYVDGDYDWVFYNKTDAIELASTPLKAGEGRSVVAQVFEGSKEIVTRIVARVNGSAGLVCSGVSQDPGEKVLGSPGGWKEYDESTVSVIISGGGGGPITSYGVSLVPYKDPLTGLWRMTGDLNVNLTANTTNPRMQIVGIDVRNDGAATGLIPVSCMNGTGSQFGGYVSASTDTFFADSSPSSSATWIWSFDIPLVDKPTWADFDGTLPQITEPVVKSNARAKYDGTGTQSIPSGTTTQITIFTVKEYDEDIGWNGSTFTVKQRGTYNLQVYWRWSTSFQIAQILTIRKNSNTLRRIITSGSSSDAETIINDETALLEVGDVIDFSIFQNSGTSKENSTSPTDCGMNITRVADTSAGDAYSFGLATADAAGLMQNYEELIFNLSTDPNAGDFTSGIIIFTKINNIVNVSSDDGLLGFPNSSGPVSGILLPENFRPLGTPRQCYYYDNSNACNIGVSSNGSFILQFQNESTSVARTDSYVQLTMSYRTNS